MGRYVLARWRRLVTKAPEAESGYRCVRSEVGWSCRLRRNVVDSTGGVLVRTKHRIVAILDLKIVIGIDVQDPCYRMVCS